MSYFCCLDDVVAYVAFCRFIRGRIENEEPRCSPSASEYCLEHRSGALFDGLRRRWILRIGWRRVGGCSPTYAFSYALSYTYRATRHLFDYGGRPIHWQRQLD